MSRRVVWGQDYEKVEMTDSPHQMNLSLSHHFELGSPEGADFGSLESQCLDKEVRMS